MDQAAKTIFDITFGRWKSQILFSGVNLGVFDSIGRSAKSVTEIAFETKADQVLLNRLLRALASLDLLTCDDQGYFSLTQSGLLLDAAHPETLKWMVMLEEGPEHYEIWKHLSDMVRDGEQNGFQREYGLHAFDYAKKNVKYADVFNKAMGSFSSIQSKHALEAFSSIDMTAARTICDVAGGTGHLLCSVLKKYDNMNGILFDLPDVVGSGADHWAKTFDVEKRFTVVAGDMFQSIPIADDYTMKMILHDWNDDECIEILKSVRTAANPGARLFIVEHLVPDDQAEHFSKLYDIHMLCWGTGTERTITEYKNLIEKAGWSFVGAHVSGTNAMGIVEAGL